MDIEEEQVGGRHKFGNIKELSLTPWDMVQQQFKEQKVLDMNRNILYIIAERDAAIEERNQALLEKRKAFEERQVAIAQRNLAIRECNDAVLEKNNALTALQQSMIDPISFGIQRPGNHMQASCSYLKCDMEILNALYKTMVASNSNKPPQAKMSQENRVYSCHTVRPKKMKFVGEDTSLKNDCKTRNIGVNKINFDGSIMPIPGCSCTGIFRPCYKWGNGGWQSSCCTNSMSAFPLPQLTNKCGRICGRKMSGSAFLKLLSRLAVEGFNFSRPVDLKEHWSKHGTNRYVTIK